jgi:hypothetical protein
MSQGYPPPPSGWGPQGPPPPGWQPPPNGYGPPPGWQQPPPQPPRPTGWEGSKTIVTCLVGIVLVVGIVVVGPFLGCAACLCVGSATSHKPASTHHR